MIYKIINSAKMRFKRVLLCCILIITTLITFSSCTTTEHTFVRAGSYDNESGSKIIRIILKNGTVINCEDKIVRFENNYDMSQDFIISAADTLKAGTINWKEQRISGTDVQKIYIEEENVDATKTVLILSGVIVLAAAVYYLLFALTFGSMVSSISK